MSEAAQRDALGQRFSVSRETLTRLDRFAGLLRKWSPVINLVSSRTLPDLWARHFLDSAQLMDIAPLASRSWADLGAGGGFPGLVVAILAAELRPDLHVTLIESDQRKSAFLSQAARELGLDTKIIRRRAEEAEPLGADVVSARALAPLTRLLDLAERHLAPGGQALFLKGRQHDAEIEQALDRWRFSVQKIRSITDPDAVVLKIKGVVRA
ncbi:16S rRNA (guanine(527)-N(7))-methyltransferase RsmG [Rhodobacteraceae bacterium WD3A24]|nr:16S rRNA (guanine(527)-N(7))-methyltransferase RsmG [Rhodobacteraceae bacterium WD3A24]